MSSRRRGKLHDAVCSQSRRKKRAISSIWKDHEGRSGPRVQREWSVWKSVTSISRNDRSMARRLPRSPPEITNL